MKKINYTTIGVLLSKLIIMGTSSSAHAQTRAEMEKAVTKAIEERTKEHLKDIEAMMEKKKVLERGEPIAVLKAIHQTLMDFDSDYGSLPSEKVTEVSDDFQGVEHLDKESSNYHFGLLIACGHADAKFETLASLPFAAIKVKADLLVTEGKILEAGECSLTYNRGLDTGRDRTSPLVLYPIVPGKKSFDATAAGGKAYVLFVDGSVKVYDVAADGSVMVEGKSFFDPTQPYWGGKMNLCYPLLKDPS
jgi:prepilin-type processing-associated H-X9-DG protein